MKNFNKLLHYETEFYGHFHESILGKGKIFSWAIQSQLDSPDIDG
jgi:hypothetical protein